MSRGRGTVVTAVALAVGVAGAAAFLLTNGRIGGRETPPAVTVTTGAADVLRADVAERATVNGTLGYADTYQVIAPGPGVLTRLAAVGRVVRRGEGLYEINGRRVVLMYGGRPAWRTFEVGMTNGADVQQLETNLRELGHGERLSVDRHFSIATYYAVRRWQQAAGLAVTGSIPLGEVVFMPEAIRVGGHDLALGVPVQPGALVVHATSARPAISIRLSPQQLPTAEVGDPVLVTLPDGTTRGAEMTHIGTAAAASGGSTGDADPDGADPDGSTVPATVRMDGVATDYLDQTQVQVAITVEARRNVLAVPITALSAVPGGEYEVVVVDGAATRRVPVRTGLFDEVAGLVEVDGAGLVEGQKVRVPRDDA
ncbi:peptidoglycan-binding domain-containing protein [Plantactinospora sonchi]|uniref:Peptidoglycan-binding domain-containing protein n=1 Tax=Plantactinospora sonchi TaxID=1544735 RepID=A0ABU7RKL5_9ACTN